jgi:hypothetical protein
MKAQLDTAGFTDYKTQYKFELDDYRAYPAWSWDYCFPQYKIAIDLDGGFEHVTCDGTGKITCDGFHQLPDGRARDNSKSNEASISGWIVLRFTQSQVEKRQAIATIRRAICDVMARRGN